MASFTILSKGWDTEEKILSDLFVSAVKSKFHHISYHRSDGKLQMVNYYEGEERLLWDVFCEESYQEYMKKYSHLEPEECNPHIVILPDNRKLFRLATSDDTSDHVIIYEFAKKYLRMFPDRIIYENWNKISISLLDIEKIELEGGYYRDWFLKTKPPS